MSYVDQFRQADDVISHLNTVIPTIADPLLQSKYAGFVAVVAITVYELAIKEVLIDFGSKKHKVFGYYTSSQLARLNGRIALKNLKEDHVSRFGENYKERFTKKLNKSARDFFRTHRRDLFNSYANLIQWRHDFAHKGSFTTHATYAEVVQAYEDGKEIIHCLARTMTR